MNLLAMLIVAVGAWAAPADKNGADAGQKIFVAKCAACHGKDGKGSAPMAKMLKVDAAKLDATSADAQKMSEADIAKIVADGRGKMKGLKDKLKDDEIKSVVAYVKSLGVKSEAPAKQ